VNTLTESQSVKVRLLIASKNLMAKLGYEQATTAAIAREAATSESQLMRHFGGKAGLLEMIFNEGWRPLNDACQQQVADATSAREALIAVLATFLAAMEHDPEMAYLLLFEGRCIRAGGTEVRLAEGLLDFNDLVLRLIRRGQKDGSFTPERKAEVITSALIGATEGMTRDRFIAKRAGRPDPFNDREIKRLFADLLQGLTGAAGASAD
jgi:AcrR family transcriptional regulator